MLFAAPPEKDIDWSDEQVDGLFRFLSRVWRIFVARQDCFSAPEAALAQAAGDALELRRKTHRTIKKVTEGMQGELKFNTGIAALMELTNALYDESQEYVSKSGSASGPKTSSASGSASTESSRAAVREALIAIAALLAPFAPHAAEELWHEVLGAPARDRLLADEPWPAFDPALVTADVVTIAIQVNGKLRGDVQAPVSAGEAEVRALAEAEERVKAHLAGKTVRKVVFVPKRLLNFVVGG